MSRSIVQLGSLPEGTRFETWNGRRTPSISGTVMDCECVSGVGVKLDNPPEGQPVIQYFSPDVLVRPV